MLLLTQCILYKILKHYFPILNAATLRKVIRLRNNMLVNNHCSIKININKENFIIYIKHKKMQLAELI